MVFVGTGQTYSDLKSLNVQSVKYIIAVYANSSIDHVNVQSVHGMGYIRAL